MRNTRFLANFLWGLVFGCSAGFVMQVCIWPRIWSVGCHHAEFPLAAENRKLCDTSDINLVLVGVMTAKPFLESRVIPAHATWVSSIPGKVIFFSSEGSALPSRPDIPIVALPGITDEYPPQRKSFAMLRYMHDHYRDQFQFFMRADDDIYIHGDILGRFLHSINSTGRALFIGQAGLGNKEEFGQLSLKHEENFCMGGPGMILSKDTLTQIRPHIGYCLHHLITSHEDVEVGRCIARFAGASCTWAYEMQKIMYNNYREPKGSFTHSLRSTDVHRAATLHPVKKAAYQYRLHQYLLSRDSDGLRNRVSLLQRHVNDMNELLQDRDAFYSPDRFGLRPSLHKSLPRFRSGVLEWEFMSSRSIHSSWISNPKRGQEEDLKIGLDDIIRQVMESINRNARQRGRVIDYKDLLYGYRRFNPLHGPDYMLDLLLVYRKFKGKRKMTVPVRRHAYLQQSFLEPAFRCLEVQHVPPVERVHFILPLAGRYKTFLRFMDNFEESCLSREGDKVALAVVLFHEAGEADEINARIAVARSRFPQAYIRTENITGAFSRGLGLQRGASLFARDALLVFMDVDIFIHSDVIRRIRMNTVHGHRVYYPIVFSQYDPQVTGVASSIASLDPDVGYWRHSGYGIMGVYNSDFLDTGGFDLEIRGWGREDVDLVDGFITRNVSVFRVVDTGLVHIFHSISCDPSLDAAQYQMCLGSKAHSYASVEKLASYVQSTVEIYRHNEVDGGISKLQHGSKLNKNALNP